MKVWVLCAASLLARLSAQEAKAETLRDLLSRSGIPSISFSQAELAEEVQGVFAEENNRVFLAYIHLQGEQFTGPVSVNEYDSSRSSMHRATLGIKQDDVCAGSFGDLSFFKNFTIISTQINPSAGCLLVVDRNLKLSSTLYGFAPVEVAPGVLVLVESLIHSAPVHPERLQAANLAKGKTLELYPPASDILRARLIAEHAKHMPPQQVCEAMNDPCDPKLFDETIDAITPEGKGRFTFVATQAASHFLKADAEGETVVSQSIRYIYQLDQGTWKYCEQEIGSAPAESRSKPLKGQSCEPNLAVVSDLTTAGYNPFFKP